MHHPKLWRNHIPSSLGHRQLDVNSCLWFHSLVLPGARSQGTSLGVSLLRAVPWHSASLRKFRNFEQTRIICILGKWLWHVSDCVDNMNECVNIIWNKPWQKSNYCWRTWFEIQRISKQTLSKFWLFWQNTLHCSKLIETTLSYFPTFLNNDISLQNSLTHIGQLPTILENCSCDK